MLTTTHIISGLLAGKYLSHTGIILIGTLLLDLDHIYYILKKRKKYGLWKAFNLLLIPHPEDDECRTFFHSILSWIIISVVLYLINPTFGTYFSFGYFMHLVLDALDTSRLILFYPYEYDVTGPMEFNSLIEYIFAIGMFLIYFFF